VSLTLRAAAATYDIGDVAGADVTTPVALEVVDPTATAALRSAKALEVPVVFRRYPVATNGLTVEFLTVFARGRADFLAALAARYQTQTLAAAAITSEDFGRFVQAYDQHGPHFPVTFELAADWAAGGDGVEVRQKLLGRLQAVSAQPVRPDELPDGFVPGQTVRLVQVTAVGQQLSLYDVQLGRLVPGADLLTVAQARKIFCEGFPAMDQPCVRAAAALLKPNCYPDASFTELLSGIAVSQLVVTEHFAAGALILHRGDKVDARAKAAIELMNEKAAAMPVAALVKTAGPLPAATPMKAATVAPPIDNPAPVAEKNAGQARWLIWILAAISAGALLVALWQMMARRRHLPAGPGSSMALTYPTESMTNLTQAMRDAVVQELALQRRELLLAQQAATDEIAMLVHRLDELQLPMQEREQTYEARIKSLENELALRTEENRELLKMKLDVVRRQLETERSSRTAAEGPWHN